MYYEGGSRGIDDDLKRFAEAVREASSGIDVVDVEPNGGGDGSGVVLRFRLNSGAVRSSQFGGPYVVVLPAEGEFDCELGEIVEGKSFSLAQDHFLVDSPAYRQNDIAYEALEPTFRGTTQMTNIRF